MPEPIFINTLHPDLRTVTLFDGGSGPPRTALSYTMGNLGVIFPSYASVYLLMAYRNLASWPISPNEQGALWNSLQSQKAKGAGERTDWVQKWENATGQSLESVPIPGPLPYNSFNYQSWAGIYNTAALHAPWGLTYSQYLNCPQDAFHTALNTLQGLTGRFGKDSPEAKEWIQTQEVVFGNCGGGKEIPEPLPSGAPAVARADRAYQIAAAHFYAGDYDQAASEFRTIAQDESSPWSAIAPYLVARSLVREATMGKTSGPDLGLLAQAETEIDSVLADPKYAEYSHAAEQLRGFIEFRLHPRQRLVELANHLTAFRGDPDLQQDLTDFQVLFPIVEQRGAYITPSPISSKLYSQLAEVRGESDMLDWIFTLRLAGPEAYSHAFEKWQSGHGQASQAWLVAALSEAKGDSPHLPELLTAASHTSPLAKAYDAVTFQSLRLLVLQAKDGLARERLAHLHIRHIGYANGPTPPSTVNLFLALGFELAQNLHQLFKNAPRIPATITTGNSNQEMPEPVWQPAGENAFDPSAARLDDDAVTVFNRFLPVALLANAVSSPELPENLRREIALAAWTRAALLGDAAVARSLAPAVETFEPEIGPSVEGYVSSKTPAGRLFAAALAALRFPGLRPFMSSVERGTPTDQIDEYRDNWWGTQGLLCAPPNPYNGRPGYPPVPQWPTVNPALQAIYPDAQTKPPAFLTPRQDAEAASEWQGLMARSPAPDYLTREAISWAKTHPADPRAPEALALAVRSTRLGCTDARTGELSKAAFGLLHSHYPNSTWAAQTKYWFGMH